jgi:hypothetical protein
VKVRKIIENQNFWKQRKGKKRNLGDVRDEESMINVIRKKLGAEDECISAKMNH